VCHLGHIAIQVGKKLKWDPDAERFAGNDETSQYLQMKPLREPWRILARQKSTAEPEA